ncbi:Ferric/cupric reductase transmembrane component 1 [Neolecta irregularis DAH-3]|uniref:ferric-chelate reductase (NADPH) n=1 Tax=Neolecta irregularis (strain DAH-3) TaxID=1198029 RepID=A0A1U7LI41_NEOID|nr:Ferric/cupric reductase transmembrane component 1 [Neolecta irregularis DAH-3]|eukprot:OLL22263.1 Ferric/cupric reductase transmembrane component 1 [Neolecta irregularis DAH-3]
MPTRAHDSNCHDTASYMFIGVMGLLVFFFGLIRVWSCWVSGYRLRTSTPSHRPLGTLTSFFRRINYRQPVAVLPSVDRLVVLGILGFAAIIFSFAEVEFAKSTWMLFLSIRTGYMSVVAVPTILILVIKFNIIGKITGHSNQQLNYIHRFGGWLVFILASVHSILRIIYLIQIDDFQERLKTSFAIRGGFALWGLLGWICISSEFRHQGYEFFLVQKLLSSFAFLILSIFFHLPKACAAYIFLGLALISTDQLWRRSRMLLKNIPCSRAMIEPFGEATKVTVETSHIDWKAGQHAYILIPELSLFQSHPFTISSRKKLEFMVLSKHGFTRKLLDHAKVSVTCRVLVDGMYGHAPNFKQFGQVMLIAVSTGASYTVPIFEDILQSLSCVRRIHFVWIIKLSESIGWYSETLKNAAYSARKLGVDVKISIYATRERELEKPYYQTILPAKLAKKKPKPHLQGYIFTVNELELSPEEDVAPYIYPSSRNIAFTPPRQPQLGHKSSFETEYFDLYLSRSQTFRSQSIKSNVGDMRNAAKYAITPPKEHAIQERGFRPIKGQSLDIPYKKGRPSIPDLIRDEVSESPYGEIGMCFCGSAALARQVRNTVCTTQKQIFLHVEGFD